MLPKIRRSEPDGISSLSAIQQQSAAVQDEANNDTGIHECQDLIEKLNDLETADVHVQLVHDVPGLEARPGAVHGTTLQIRSSEPLKNRGSMGRDGLGS